MKKGQIQTIFTWIFILILIGLVLFYGIKTVRKTVSFGEDAVVANFLKELDKKIKLYYSLDIESTSVEEFKLTSKVKYVCFTEYEDFDNDPIGLTEKDINYLENLKEYDSVFVIPPVGRENRVNISRLDLDKNPKCFSVKGGILKIKLNTTRDGVNVHKAA